VYCVSLKLALRKPGTASGFVCLESPLLVYDIPIRSEDMHAGSAWLNETSVEI
jgi:hypothetical protein